MITWIEIFRRLAYYIYLAMCKKRNGPKPSYHLSPGVQLLALIDIRNGSTPFYSTATPFLHVAYAPYGMVKILVIEEQHLCDARTDSVNQSRLVCLFLASLDVGYYKADSTRRLLTCACCERYSVEIHVVMQADRNSLRKKKLDDVLSLL